MVRSLLWRSYRQPFRNCFFDDSPAPEEKAAEIASPSSDEDDLARWRERVGWSSPRQRRVVPELPDGAGSASETERHTDRNQWLKASQYETTDSNLADAGRVASRTFTASAVRGTPGLGDVAGREATVKACGVAVARMLGHNWVPIPSKGSRVNVGTIPASSEVRRRQRRHRGLSARPADRAG